MAWTEAAIPDLHGRQAIVTGGNSGIGFATARALARRGASVVIAARDPQRGAAAADAIRVSDPAAQVRAAALDLADLAGVRGFAGGVDAPVDLLVNNAGVMALPTRAVTADGFERQLGVNHLGHFALTMLLMPQLAAAPAARVVSVSSIAHRRGEMRFDDLQLQHSYTPWRAYTQSKLANLLFSFELDRRLRAAASPVMALAAHPGVAATNLAASGPGQAGGLQARLVGWTFDIVGQDAAHGARPILYAATTSGIEPGSFWGPDGLREMRGDPAPALVAPPARDAAAAAELWRRSAALTGTDLPGIP